MWRRSCGHGARAGGVEPSLQVAQEGEDGGDFGDGVLVDAMQAHQGVEDEQARSDVLDGVVQALAVGAMVEAQDRHVDDGDVEAFEGGGGGAGDAFEAAAHDMTGILGGEQHDGSGLCGGEVTQARDGGGDADGEVECEEGCAALGFAADDADGVAGPQCAGVRRVPEPHARRHGAAPAAQRSGVCAGERRGGGEARGVRRSVSRRHRRRAVDRRRRGRDAGRRVVTRQLVITEKSSQAKDVRAPVGSRYGAVRAAEGHLLDLCEPEDVNPAWKRWSTALLKPEGLYATKPASGGNKAAKLKTIRAALKSADRVWLATDCDREGQLIGQEILEHCRYRGEVLRVMFTAQDPQTIRSAFGRARPNAEHVRLYEAAFARRQADQIYNLSLTRTATVTLGRGARNVIGIGRVKTPTLAIACRRELEIRDFVAVAYFEVVATARARGGAFRMRHAPKERIVERARAQAVLEAARDFEGPLRVRVEDRRQRPPRLHDLPSLQKLASSRFGWSASKTLDVAQALYDGEGKKILTYPRAEVRYLPGSAVADAATIVAGLQAGRSYASVPAPRFNVIDGPRAMRPVPIPPGFGEHSGPHKRVELAGREPRTVTHVVLKQHGCGGRAHTAPRIRTTFGASVAVTKRHHCAMIGRRRSSRSVRT